MVRRVRYPFLMIDGYRPVKNLQTNHDKRRVFSDPWREVHLADADIKDGYNAVQEYVSEDIWTFVSVPDAQTAKHDTIAIPIQLFVLP